MTRKLDIPSNIDAQPCVRNVMMFLADIVGDRIVAGQHTQTMAMEELEKIHEVTGREPALLGFELLSYSPNINEMDTDEECMTEVRENRGTLERAWEWAGKKGLITFTWHWFSPLGGRSKAFYTKNTDFDAWQAVTPGTAENHALLSDMDEMAELLRPFCMRGIPILWRPFHEMDGDWFWWGSKGPEPAKRLWRLMYERFTERHGLNNLIWVWNAGKQEYYPGDDVVDIISLDLYPEPHQHSSHKEAYEAMTKIPEQPKIVLLGEIGVLPDVERIHEEMVGWTTFMTWSKEYCLSEEYSSFSELKKVYDSPYVITKEDLPELY